MDVNDVAAELAQHEAVCAERWKTIFTRIEKIDADSGIRFDRQDRSYSEGISSCYGKVCI